MDKHDQLVEYLGDYILKEIPCNDYVVLTYVYECGCSLCSIPGAKYVRNNGFVSCFKHKLIDINDINSLNKIKGVIHVDKMKSIGPLFQWGFEDDKE